MPDNRRKLYDALSKDYDMGTFEQFSNDIQDADKRRKLYDTIKDTYDLPDFNGFTSQLGIADKVKNANQRATKPNYTFTADQVDSIERAIQQGNMPHSFDADLAPSQPLQMPQGFGQLDAKQAQRMGLGKGPVSWGEESGIPDHEETAVGKQQRMMQGKATQRENKQVQSRMQQRKDEIVYKKETGKDLRNPVLNTSFEAPTVEHDDNGNILIGNSTDQDRASAHQQVMTEQTAWDALSDNGKQERMKQMQSKIEQDEYEEPGFLGVTGKKLSSGFIKAGLGLLNGMKALASGMIVEDASSPTGYSKTEDYNPATNNDAFSRGLESANQYAERMSREGEPRRGASFTEMLLDGDISGFLLKGLGSSLESAPMTLSIYNPYTVALNAISMAGNNFRENTIDNPDISAWKRASMAIGSAAIEQAVEKFADPVFKYFNGGRILSWFGKTASKESAKKITKEAESVIANRIMSVLKDAASEGAEEVITNFGNDVLGQALDLLNGESDYGIVAQWRDLKKSNPNASLADFAAQKARENLDAFFGGALGGAYMSGTAQVTAAGLQYATGNRVSPEQIANTNEPIHPATLDIAQSFDEGYLIDGNERNDAKNNLDLQRQKAVDTFGDIAGLDTDPIATLQTMREGGYTPEQLQVALDYVNAKATYDGMIQRVHDDLQGKIDASNSLVDSHTNKADGLVHPITTTTDTQMYVVGGQVVIDADGNVDADKSKEANPDGMLLAVDAESGKVVTIAVDDIKTADTPIDAQQQKQQAQQAIMQQFGQQAADQIEGKLAFAPNDQYNVLADDGQAHVITILQDNGDGSVTATIDGMQEPAVMSKEQVQAWSDAANLARLQQHEQQQADSRAQQAAEEQQADIEPLTDDEIQVANNQQSDNPEGEAGAATGTGANEPSGVATPKEVAMTSQPTQEEETRPAIERIPVLKDDSGKPVLNKKGKPQYQWHQAPVEDTADALTEQAAGSMLVARDVAADMIAKAKDDAEKANKMKAKGDDPIELIESRNAIAKAQLQAQDIVRYWQDVNKELQRRLTEETNRKQAEREAAKSEEQRRQEAEQARLEKERKDEAERQRIREQIEKDQAKRNKEYEPLVQARKEMQDDAEALSILDDTEPRDLQEWVSSLLRAHSILWQDASDAEVGLKTELGLKRADIQRFMTLLGTKESGAKPFGQVVLDIYEGLPDAVKQQVTDQDVRNTLLDLFNEGNSARMTNLAKEHRIEEARQVYNGNLQREADAEMDAWCEAYHLTAEERATFEDFMQEPPMEPEQEIINQIIADNEQNQSSERMDQQPVSGGNAEGTEEGESQVQGTAEAAVVGTDTEGMAQGTDAGSSESTIPNNDVAGGASADRGAIAVLLTQIGTNAELSQFMSDSEVAQLTALIDAWEVVNDEYGQVIEQQQKALESKNEATRDAAQKKIDKAQEKANKAFAPVESYVRELNEKYGIKQEDRIPANEQQTKTLQEIEVGDVFVDRNDNSHSLTVTSVNNQTVTYVAERFGMKLEPKTENKVLFEKMVKDFYSPYNKPESQPIGKTSTPEEIAAEEGKVDINPTDAQKEAGNYQKGHINVDGYDITIENPKGSVRSGVDANGNKWETTMHNTYGYIRNTEGVDGDHIDVFLSDNPTSGNVFVIDQVNQETGAFDEHKVMYGFPDAESARKAYLSNYEEGWQGLGGITEVSREEFKKWVESSHRKTKPFAEYKSVKKPAADAAGTGTSGNVRGENGENSGEEAAQPYTISPAQYTNKKGKTTDMHLVTFEHELTKEQIKAGKELAKASRGWWDSKQGGFMMRDAESAQQLAEALSNENAVADAQPLSLKDMSMAMEQTEAEQEENPNANYKVGDTVIFLNSNKTARLKGKIVRVDKTESFGTEYEVESIIATDNGPGKGVTSRPHTYTILEGQIETKVAAQPQQTEQPKQEQPQRLVSDERMEELRARLRAKLLGQANMGVDPEILAIGAELAVGHIERGLTKFADYAKTMIEDLGDAIRPYLKAFYNAVRDMPEAEEYAEQMDSYDDVRTFNVMSIGQEGANRPSLLDVAEEVVKEQEVEQQQAVAEEKMKEQRNDGRKAQEEGVALDGTPLRAMTAADLDERDIPVYYQGRRVYVMLVARSGEQVSATQFSKPKIDYIMLTNGKSVQLADLMVADSEKQPSQETIEQRKARWQGDAKKKSEEKGEKTSSSKKKSVSLQQEPDLFGNSFDEDATHVESQNERNNDERRENRPSPSGISKGESAGSRTADDSRLDGSLQEGRNVGQGDSSVSPAATGERKRSERPAGRLQGIAPQQTLERPANPKNTHNNHAERGTDYAPSGVDARIDANIKAIELMKQLMDSGEQATPEQMAVLRQFSGWGGLGKAFENYTVHRNGKPQPQYLRELLGEEAYEQANMSRNSAYYTPAHVIDTLWDVARAMGFKGGKVLEGSAGIGNILGLMPTDMSERSDIQAVEIDQTTGNILSLLYPDAKVDVQGFEATQVENGSVDLAITNVPFVTGLHVNDTTGDKDLSKKFRDIHDFCIAKNVRKLKEGGIGIFITSSGTLDNSARLREWIVQEGGADVVGAFRLNNETFGGTGATSDIIVIRKRVNGKKSPHAIDVLSTTGERTAEYDTGETKKVKGEGIPVVKHLPMDYNSYFVEHPEMMGGEMRFNFEMGETRYPTSRSLFPVKGKNQTDMLKAWAQSFSGKDWGAMPAADAAGTTADVYEELGEGVKEGSMVVDKKGNLCIAQRGKAVPLAVNANKVKGHSKVECFEAYQGIKKALADLLEYQTNNEDDAGLQPRLKALNKAYDDFVKTYGHLHKNTSISFLKNDVDFANILALEKFSERGDVKTGKRIQEFGKTDIFSQRVVDKEKAPEPDNVKDGIIASIYVHGRIDVPWIVEQLNKNGGEKHTEQSVKAEIVSTGLGFENPATRQMEVSYEYLSGNVREKLAQARANNADGQYNANIKALEAVVPMDIPSHLIDFNIGSSWIDPKLYEEYVKEKTDVDVTFTPAGGTWFMKTPNYVGEQKNRAMGVVSELLHKTIPGTQLIEAAMQNKTITVSETHKKWDGTTETITDKEATQACASKIDEIRQDFKDWARAKMQSDPAMSERIERTYNDLFNNYVPTAIPAEFVPAHFGGAATTVDGRPFSLRPHQGKAVVRGTMQPLLLAHEVGTGKTYTLISTAMEMRRLGTARKPMIVVQNATVGQFVESAKKLYPNAKVLTLEDKDHTGEGRKNFYAKIKYNDWDMIVVPQSVFERIPDSEERQMKFVKDKIQEKELVLEQMRDADPSGNSMIVKQAEKEIEKLADELLDLSSAIVDKRKERDEKRAAITRQNAEVKALEMLDRQTDDVENFDDMGIDAILVDEAHEYKHLGFATAMQRGVKGVDPSYSKKAQGVYLKTQAVLEKNNGRNVIFATGTPISNTAAEIWTFMRYLMPADTMKEYDIYYFDDFVRNFGNLQQMLEFTTSGKFKENNRFAGYVNLPELVRIWAGVADTVLTREAGGVSDKIPDMESGKAIDIYLPQTRALRSVMKFVKKQLDDYDNMSGKQKKENSHIPLTMYGIAKAAAVDARLVVSDAADEPQSKTNEAVRQTLKSLRETESYNGTVALFADNYQNKKSGFNLYEDIRRKLIEQGLPAEQIVVMKSGMSVKKKLEIFDKVNRGEVRVIMGSTFTLGTGVNIQERLNTLIHLDAPNRPMDYTQRNGRILRQGNLHKEMGKPVRVLRFGVEDSLDVTAYQRLKTKGAIADSIMNGKQMMNNSMENRALEEEDDVFGDTVAQLSGSEYAMLKNQAEKDVRKYEAKKKQYQADQTYCHNEIPRLEGEIKTWNGLLKNYRKSLATIESLPAEKTITVGKQSFPSVEAMADFIKEYNKTIKEAENELRDNPSLQSQTRRLTVNVGGIDFVFNTELSVETKHDQGTLFTAIRRRMTYNCDALGLSDVPVRQSLLREGLEDIMQNVITGQDARDGIELSERVIEKNEKSLAQVRERYGKPFEFDKELEQAHERLDEYSELMKKELEEKEKKYAEMDADVEEASDINEAEESDEEAEEEDDVRMREGTETPDANATGTTAAERTAERQKQAKEYAERQWRRAHEVADEWTQKLGLSDVMQVVDSIEDVPGSDAFSKRKRRAKGWYDAQTGKIVIVLGNHRSPADVLQTILHEAVGHYGLRKLFGQNFDTFLDNVYQSAALPIKERIAAIAAKQRQKDTPEGRARRSNQDYLRIATEEYLAGLAENTDFEDAENKPWVRRWFNQIKAAFIDMLKKVGLRGFAEKGVELSDNELRYILWRSYKNMTELGRNRNVFDVAENVAMEYKLGVGNYEREMLRDKQKEFASPYTTLFRDEEEDGEEVEDAADVDAAAEGYDAGKMTLEESITKGLLDLAQKNEDNLQLRINAMRQIGGNLNKLRSAMARQREYDRQTVDSIVRLAKMVIDSGLFKGFTPYEVKRLMGMVNRAAGREDITKQAGEVVDLMIRHQLKELDELFHSQMKVKGSKLNNSGVEVQAGLDIDGQRMVKAMKDAMSVCASCGGQTQDQNGEPTAWGVMLEDVFDRMGDDDEATAHIASVEYQGYLTAQQWFDTVKSGELEERVMRHDLKQAKEEQKAGRMTREEYKQYRRETEAAIRESRLERIAAYEKLISTFGAGIKESIDRAEEWRERERQRVNEIHHNANSDLLGVPADEHRQLTWQQKAANWSFVRFFMKPLATFNELLRYFGSKSVDGKGYLWNRFIPGVTDASDREWKNLHRAHEILDAKASEVFGKDMSWSDLFDEERKMPTVSVEFWDAGEKKSYDLTQGNLLYIYLVNKMTDGRMKLRKMGITEEDVEAIKDRIDPRFLALGEWLQDVFLKDKRKEYNAVYERMFGAPMPTVHNYFPLRINSRSRGQEEDIGEPTYSETKPATITGSVIKRTRNSLPLDITGADAFDVVLGHLQDMEHWAAYAELNRDMNTLFSYKRFRNRVMNMSSTRFGAGNTLWKNFKDAAAIAAGSYRPPVNRNSLDTYMVNIAKGVTQAKIAFRLYTALKQLLSYPAYFSEANVIELAKSTVTAPRAWNWAMEELPGFAKRWQSRQAGDNRLDDTDVDWQFWRNKIVRIASRMGMKPNAFVDALTVAMGAKAIYETRLKQYKTDGYSDEQAKQKALHDASIAYNETQQSSEGAYISEMQVSRSAASVALSVFRNAPFAYQRRLFRAIANLKHKMTPGYQKESIEFMRKKMVREGVPEGQAQQVAERVYNRSWYEDVANVAIFGSMLQAAWNLGPYLAYLFLGDDDDEKDKMYEDALKHAVAGSVEGLTGGNVMSDLYNMVRNGDNISSYNFNLLPLMSDVQTMMRHYNSDMVQAANDFVNIMVQSGVGVNPQTLTDLFVALTDYTNGDPQTSKEFALLMLRVASAPQSAIDKLYIDELGLTAADARKADVTELAHRYARYKRRRNAPLTGWAYSDEARDAAEGRYVRRFEDMLKERSENMSDESLQKAFEENSDETVKKALGNRAAKRLDAKDTYGSPTTEYGKVYLRMRNYFDMAEDILLQTEEKKAKEAGDEERYDDIKKARKDLTDIKRDLADARSDEERNSIMQELRRERTQYLQEFGISKGNR